MADLTLLTRAVRTVADDTVLRDDIIDAFRSSRRAVLRPAPKPTRLRRAGDAVQSVGAVVTRAGAKAEAQRRAERRTRVLRVAVAGGAVAAAAAAAAFARQSSPTTNGGPDV